MLVVCRALNIAGLSRRLRGVTVPLNRTSRDSLFARAPCRAQFVTFARFGYALALKVVTVVMAASGVYAVTGSLPDLLCSNVCRHGSRLMCT